MSTTAISPWESNPVLRTARAYRGKRDADLSSTGGRCENIATKGPMRALRFPKLNPYPDIGTNRVHDGSDLDATVPLVRRVFLQ